MPAPEPPVPLEKAVVAPLFERFEPAKPGADSVPPIVAEHRRRRARDRIVDALASRGTAKVPAELRLELEALIRRWAASGFDDGFSDVTDFEIRCARERDLVVAEEAGDRDLVLAALEQDYRRKVIERFGRIELR